MKVRRFVAVGVAAALTATVVSCGHDADRQVVKTPITEAQDEATALMAAQRQGTQVEVAGLKTESSRFFANPGGTMTMRQSLVPERVKLGGAWVDIDPTLVKREDGRFEPKATAPGVVFSGGGNQPFARMGVGDWEIALTWPRELPAPHVSGDTATYPKVLPGVDLRARVGQRREEGRRGSRDRRQGTHAHPGPRPADQPRGEAADHHRSAVQLPRGAQ